jgi:phosphoglycolate phosphatase-like HAD superfamily hydrolase
MKRLILFDVDGTLVSTHGAGSRAVRAALIEVFGETGPIDSYDFHGRTDPQIVRALMREAGFDDHAIDGRMDDVWGIYLQGLERELASPDANAHPLPGVIPLLDALHETGDDLVALLTGNIEPGARLKLGAVDLWDRFDFGAYGSDHERRDQLPAVAVRRAKERTGLEFAGRDIVIIGDTPFDVTCGEALGVRTVAVATGKHTTVELADAGADAVFHDFSDTAAVVGAITGTTA